MVEENTEGKLHFLFTGWPFLHDRVPSNEKVSYPIARIGEAWQFTIGGVNTLPDNYQKLTAYFRTLMIKKDEVTIVQNLPVLSIVK